MKCGLLGGKLGHSYSPQIHSYLGDYSYDLYEKKPEELESFLLHGDFSGLNVTIPYKKAVIAYCDVLSERAQKLSAVNTIVRRADGSLVGHNTDYFGFSSMLQMSGLRVEGKEVLVLGSGGASATAVAVLKELGADVFVISRSGEHNYQNLYLHKNASLIVNSTPVGMYPNVGVSAVDLSLFSHLEGVLDVVYNPARTQLLLDAESRGLVAMNGLWMLVAQAKESAEWFTGRKIPETIIAEIHRKLRTQMENTILIGMPGCGKSTIGKLVSQILNKRFVDADEVIAKTAGMSIPEIFSTSGETGFRNIETQVLRQLGMQSGLVIATGGGCVTRDENYSLLHQNGTIYWLKRAISFLPTDGRPLSQKNSLTQMYDIRKPMYQKFADHIILNNDNADNAASAIAEKEMIL
ncbi:MAG: shikimate kinase [Oscillospiraceae bacterium]|nr:shikimate kinase [Oscillospiraceae bacterium]